MVSLALIADLSLVKAPMCRKSSLSENAATGQRLPHHPVNRHATVAAEAAEAMTTGWLPVLTHLLLIRSERKAG